MTAVEIVRFIVSFAILIPLSLLVVGVSCRGVERRERRGEWRTRR